MQEVAGGDRSGSKFIKRAKMKTPSLLMTSRTSACSNVWASFSGPWRRVRGKQTEVAAQLTVCFSRYRTIR